MGTGISIQYITDENGEKTAAIIPIKQWEEFARMIDEYLELESNSSVVNDVTHKSELTPIQQGYKEMSEDTEREQEAFEWIENTLNTEEI